MPPKLEKLANVVLRVPSIVLLDLLYRWDIQAFAELLNTRSPDSYLQKHHLWNIYYAGHVVCVVVLLLPVRSLVKMYLYILTVLLLYVSHQTARDYIRHEIESDFHGAVYSDPVTLTCFATALTSQVIVATLCALLLQTKQVWLFCAPLLPLTARLCCFPLQALTMVNTFAACLTAMEALYIAVSGLSVLFHLTAAACRDITQVLEIYQLVTLGMSLWRQLSVPLLFLVFWLALFTLKIYALASSSSGNLLSQQGIIFVFLSSVAECCSTPYSLIGLTFTISYLALGLLKLCKFYLAGYGAFQNGNVMHRGVTEGVTLLLLAIQTGLLDLQLLQRTFLLSIILFIVVTSTLQSMIEIADPIVLGLGASRNRSFWKHGRAVSMCLFLLVFPGFMAYKIAHFFHMDFWLLILVSSCMLTSLQMMGTLFIYALFMIELVQDSPMEKMDEIIYYVNAISRVLEFLVAVCVVAYGTWESIFGEWSWMGASVIIIHCYFNVWLRAQSGWKSFLLRREAAKKISLLPGASREQLEHHNDVCAICFQEMSIAVIMQCGHLFHGNCLRKWFYVQDTCPLCHQPVRPMADQENQMPHGSTQAAELTPVREEDSSSGGEDQPVSSRAEDGSDDRTAGANNLNKGHLQDPSSAGPSDGEKLHPFGRSVESMDLSPLLREVGTSSTAAEGGHRLDCCEPPPVLERPMKLQIEDQFGWSEGPMRLRQNCPGSSVLPKELACSSAQVERNLHLAMAVDVLPEGHLKKHGPNPAPVDPSVVAEGKEETTHGNQQQGTALSHLECSVKSDGQPKHSLDPCISFSPP